MHAMRSVHCRSKEGDTYGTREQRQCRRPGDGFFAADCTATPSVPRTTATPSGRRRRRARPHASSGILFHVIRSRVTHGRSGIGASFSTWKTPPPAAAAGRSRREARRASNPWAAPTPRRLIRVFERDSTSSRRPWVGRRAPRESNRELFASLLQLFRFECYRPLVSLSPCNMACFVCGRAPERGSRPANHLGKM